MNQQYEYPPPPPPPTSGPRSPDGTAISQRQRQGPAQRPSITTNVVRPPATSSQIPASAPVYTFASGTPLHYTPNTPSPLNPRTPGTLAPPPSAVSPGTSIMQPYNPGQWNGRSQVSGSQMVFQQRAGSTPVNTRDATGMEGACESSLI